MPASTEPRRERLDSATVVLLGLLAWIVPGAGHLWVRRTHKALVFLVVLPLMFAIGLALEGRIFPFVFSEPLVGLAAIADLGAGWPYFLSRLLGLGSGNVVAVSYEYGNTFMIASGLLNALVVLDACDIAMGRK